LAKDNSKVNFSTFGLYKALVVPYKQ
jgi:hypothetical protein